ncbi:MAG: hypothetical protein LRY57_05135 [Alphaproteobacteria bacterium]|nr:hypothetical protein [Alphaproteobacteria bacterium]
MGGVAQVLGKQPKETGVLWERIAPHILPAVEEVRKLLIRQAVKGIHAELRNGDVPPEQRNRGFWGPLAKVGFSLARHFFLSRGGSGSLYTNNDVLLGLAQLGRNLTGQFDGQDVRIENNGWDPFLKEMGVFDKKLSDSPIGIIYGAHHKEKAQPFYLGYIPPELLSAEFKDGLLLGGHDVSHGEALKAVTTLPFIFKPHKLAEGITLEDMILADGPHNLVSWLTTRCPLNPKYGSIKVIFMGSGDRHDELNAKAGVEQVGLFERILEFKNGAKNGSRRASFASMRRDLARFNGHHGAEQDLYVLDTADNPDHDFTNTSLENVNRIRKEAGAESWRQNWATYEAITDLLAHNYIVERDFDRAMAYARSRIIADWRTANLLDQSLSDVLNQTPPLESWRSYDINDEMGPDPTFAQCPQNCSVPPDPVEDVIAAIPAVPPDALTTADKPEPKAP